MRLDFFQRLLDRLGSNAVVINETARVVLASALARRELALAPGDGVEVVLREGERVLIRQPHTQQLYSATGLRWLKFEFLLLETPLLAQPVRGDSDGHHQALLELCRRPAVQASLPPAERQALRAILSPSSPLQDRAGDLIDPVELIHEALAPPLNGMPQLYLQVPLPPRKIRGQAPELAAALRSLTDGLIASHRSRRLLVRLHQGRDELLLTIQDIGPVELSGMQLLETGRRWSGLRLDPAEACEAIERCGGTLRIRGPVAHGRISISLPSTADDSAAF